MRIILYTILILTLQIVVTCKAMDYAYNLGYNEAIADVVLGLVNPETFFMPQEAQ